MIVNSCRRVQSIVGGTILRQWSWDVEEKQLNMSLKKKPARKPASGVPSWFLSLLEKSGLVR